MQNNMYNNVSLSASVIETFDVCNVCMVVVLELVSAGSHTLIHRQSWRK